MSSGPNIPDEQRTNKRKSLSLTPPARAVADAHPGEASRLASAGLVLLGTMATEPRELLIKSLARDPESVARAVEALFATALNRSCAVRTAYYCLAIGGAEPQEERR